MTWFYQQSTGKLSHDNEFIAIGYSGTGEGRNNSDAQEIQGMGPIPCGEYSIGPSYVHPHLGPCVMNLDAKEGTDTFGRSLFRMHGDNAAHDASHGCIIMGPTVRQMVASSDDKNLKVVA